MLVSAAAAQWNVPAGECAAQNHEVVHQASGRRLAYGALVPAAAKLPVPKAEDLQFKPKSAWRFVGKDTAIYDQTDIVTGKAQFGHDVFRDGMVHASIEHPPVFGGSVRRVDDSEALKVRGVQQTVTLDALAMPYLFKPLGGVAVIADSTWAAFQGRRAAEGRMAGRRARQLRVAALQGADAADRGAARQGRAQSRQRGRGVRQGRQDARGDATTTPMLAHASMEPPTAVADFKDGKVTIWAPTQNPQAVQETVAAAVGIDKKDVTCHVTLLGGGFGRKSKPDYTAEAAVLSKRLGKPVKVVWTREDDIRFDYYHTPAVVYHKASVDEKGRPTAWLQRSVFPPIAAMFDEKAQHGAGFELDMGLTDLPFDVPNIRAENGAAEAHVRIGWFRSVSNIYHAFAAHSFADELAHAAGRDPLEFLLELLGPGKVIDLKAQGVDYSNYGAPLDRYPVDSRRLRRVLEVAGERAGWANRARGNGRGMGIAAHRSFNSYVASVVEVEIDSRGVLRVPRIEQVVDAGTIVNPDRVRSQFEGAAVMALGLARSGEISALNGRIRQSNFNDFQVARMNDAPLVTNVHFIDSDALPTGVGEPGVPPVLAALGNAIFAATGKRIRELPLSRQKLV